MKHINSFQQLARLSIDIDKNWNIGLDLGQSYFKLGNIYRDFDNTPLYEIKRLIRL